MSFTSVNAWISIVIEKSTPRCLWKRLLGRTGTRLLAKRWAIVFNTLIFKILRERERERDCSCEQGPPPMCNTFSKTFANSTGYWHGKMHWYRMQFADCYRLHGSVSKLSQYLFLSFSYQLRKFLFLAKRLVSIWCRAKGAKADANLDQGLYIYIHIKLNKRKTLFLDFNSISNVHVYGVLNG